jgi:hypothetical protein
MASVIDFKISLYHMKLNSFLISGVFAILVSCHSVVQTEFPDFERKPVINSILRAGDSIRLQLSTTKKIGSVDFEFINNAEIRVFANNEFVEKLINKNGGYYVSTTIVKPQTTYTFSIKIPDYETVTCKDSIPKVPQIIEVKHISKAGRDEEGSYYPAVEVTFKDSPSIMQWFEIDIIQQKTCYEWDTIVGDFFKYKCTEGMDDGLWMPDIDDPVLLNEGVVMTLFSNVLITGTTYKMQINYTSGSQHGAVTGGYVEDLYPLIVELRAVSESYYNYKKQLILNKIGNYADGIGQSVNAIPLYSNVENGYGIVAGYSYCSTDTITPEPYEY